jgi:hypothetical protein
MSLIDALAVAQERAVRLRREAAAERLRDTSTTRHVVWTLLRRVADRVDPTPLSLRPVLSRHER